MAKGDVVSFNLLTYDSYNPEYKKRAKKLLSQYTFISVRDFSNSALLSTNIS